MIKFKTSKPIVDQNIQPLLTCYFDTSLHHFRLYMLSADLCQEKRTQLRILVSTSNDKFHIPVHHALKNFIEISFIKGIIRFKKVPSLSTAIAFIKCYTFHSCTNHSKMRLSCKSLHYNNIEQMAIYITK